MPMISNPLSSTIDVHTSTIKGTYSDCVDYKKEQLLEMYNKIFKSMVGKKISYRRAKFQRYADCSTRRWW